MDHFLVSITQHWETFLEDVTMSALQEMLGDRMREILLVTSETEQALPTYRKSSTRESSVQNIKQDGFNPDQAAVSLFSPN